MTHSTIPTFNHWMQQLDRLCIDTYGFSIHDLPDQNYRDLYNEGATVAEAFAEIADNENLDDYFLSGAAQSEVT
jgi:hypothetical protein